MQEANVVIDTASKAADLVKKVASSESKQEMGEIRNGVGFTEIHRAFFQQLGVTKDDEGVRWNVLNAMASAISSFEHLKQALHQQAIIDQVPKDELFDHNLDLERRIAVVNVVAPSGQGYVSSFAYGWLPARKAYGYVVRIVMVNFKIANDWTVVTHTKKNFLRSKTTQTIQELPTSITMERWEAITQVLLGDKPEETSIKGLLQLE